MNELHGDPEAGADEALQETAAEIERTRARLAASIGALRQEVATLADWRSWVRRNPAPYLAGAFALGLLLGWRATGR